MVNIISFFFNFRYCEITKNFFVGKFLMWGFYGWQAEGSVKKLRVIKADFWFISKFVCWRLKFIVDLQIYRLRRNLNGSDWLHTELGGFGTLPKLQKSQNHSKYGQKSTKQLKVQFLEAQLHRGATINLVRKAYWSEKSLLSINFHYKLCTLESRGIGTPNIASRISKGN